MCKIFILQV